jgi:hypothetical protein
MSNSKPKLLSLFIYVINSEIIAPWDLSSWMLLYLIHINGRFCWSIRTTQTVLRSVPIDISSSPNQSEHYVTYFPHLTGMYSVSVKIAYPDTTQHICGSPFEVIATGMKLKFSLKLIDFYRKQGWKIGANPKWKCAVSCTTDRSESALSSTNGSTYHYFFIFLIFIIITSLTEISHVYSS